jgi:predicted ester cyclase
VGRLLRHIRAVRRGPLGRRPHGGQVRGHRRRKDLYQSIHAALPDFEVTVTHEYHVPGTTILEATLSGTHQGEYLGVEPEGNPVTFEVCAVFEFGEGEDAGKILCERCYFDNETLLRQMRGEADASTAVLGLAERSR